MKHFPLIFLILFAIACGTETVLEEEEDLQEEEELVEGSGADAIPSAIQNVRTDQGNKETADKLWIESFDTSIINDECIVLEGGVNPIISSCEASFPVICEPKCQNVNNNHESCNEEDFVFHESEVAFTYEDAVNYCKDRGETILRYSIKKIPSFRSSR